MAKSYKTWKKLHRWPGLILSLFLFYYALTGIFLNHRELFAGLDINRYLLPANYQYQNWNNAAIKGNVVLNKDSILVYGNIGIWLTDSSYLIYQPFYKGFPNGIDNRKIFDIHHTANGHLYAAAFSGFYAYNRLNHNWIRINTGKKSGRFTGITSIGDTVITISRSYLYKGKAHGIKTKLDKVELPAPPGYKKKVTLFQTMWQIHSGEIFGIPGKIYVDLIGLITLFLSVTGIIWFFFPGWIKRRRNNKRPVKTVSEFAGWSLKWHNIIGSWTFILLIIVFFTGMFLRPPLLIAIARAKVPPLKYSHLDQPNPWYDKLRDLLYDSRNDMLLLSTSEGMYSMNRNDLIPRPFDVQPPVSVMGINVFEKSHEGSFLIGSFSGIFSWNPETGSIVDLYTGKPYTGSSSGRPVGDMKVSGAVSDYNDRLYLSEYSIGIVPLESGKFPGMPENILQESTMSLWSVCLEIHTGRFFEQITGDFYILIVPLTGLAGIIIVISGYMVWRRKYRK